MEPVETTIVQDVGSGVADQKMAATASRITTQHPRFSELNGLHSKLYLLQTKIIH